MRVTVAGAGGAIGGHLVARLLADGNDVLAVDVKPIGEWWQVHPEATSRADADCSRPDVAAEVVSAVDWVFDLAENMGGIGFITANRVTCSESVGIGMALLRAAAEEGVGRFWFCSSACVYPAHRQDDQANPGLRESDAWPARPEEGYGLAKLYVEEVCRFYREDGRLDTRVGRYHNVYGRHGTWRGGREKAPAAICRKVAVAKLTGAREVEVWGDGQATRSFMHVDDCVEGTLRLMASDCSEPLNVGSSRLISVDGLVALVAGVAGCDVRIKHVPGPQGVRGRTSDNTRVREVLGWEPGITLENGLRDLYPWVEQQVREALARGENV